MRLFLGLGLVVLIAIGCRAHSSATPPPTELAAYATHLSYFTTYNDQGTITTSYNIDQSFDDAIAVIEPLLKKAGYTTKGTHAGSDFTATVYDKDRKHTFILHDDPGPREPGRKQVSLDQIVR
jgi:hypothetical protein